MRQNDNKPERAATTRRPYEPPRLRALGNVREITRSQPSGNDFDEGGRKQVFG